MKLGIVISLVLLVLLSLLGLFAFWGISDPASAATNQKNLVKMSLPTDLGPLFVSNNPSGDTVAIYEKILDLYHENSEAWYSDTPPTELNNKLIQLLIEAMQCERVQDGFLDKHIAVQPGATPDFDDALESIPGIALAWADQMYDEGKVAHAISATRAVWALGQRAFQNNTRLYIRSQGLTIMLDAGDQLLPWTRQVSGLSELQISEWMKVAHEIDQVWSDKYELTARLRPKIGDLLNIARHDQDTSFRVAAILKLGLAKFNPGGRGNKRMILDTIEEAKNHSDPLIVQAGIAAAAMTSEQMHKLY